MMLSSHNPQKHQAADSARQNWLKHTKMELVYTSSECCPSTVHAKKGLQELTAFLGNIDNRVPWIGLDTQIQVVARQMQRARERYSEHVRLMALAQNEAELSATCKVSFQGTAYDLGIQEQRIQLQLKLSDTQQKLSDNLNKALSLYEVCLSPFNSAWETAQEDLLSMAERPELIDAFELWGISRNHARDHNSGSGYHAGFIHLFEYRLFEDKSSRFKDPHLQDLSIKSFVNLAEELRPLLRPKSIADLAPMKCGLLFGDNEGRQRLITVINNLKVVAFKRIGEPMRLISVYPVSETWQADIGMGKEKHKELSQPAHDNRFNRLGENRKLICEISLPKP